MPNIVCVVPTVRPDRFRQFQEAWADLFAKHKVTLLTVWDGDRPDIELDGERFPADAAVPKELADVFCHKTDSVRNYGFYYAAKFLNPSVVLTFDDDVLPMPGTDPIADHLSVLGRRVPLSWMNTGMDTAYFRGVPYAVRAEAVVHLSHGVWVGTPDYDGPTQLAKIPDAIADPHGYANPPFFRGPVPRGVLFPYCGMSVAFTRTAAPLVMYAPMGPRGHGFNRFGDIWAGVALKRAFDERNWAVWTGASVVNHSRASDVFVNLAQEAEGLRWNERFWAEGDDTPHPYFREYADRRARYAAAVAGLLGVPA